MNSYGTLNPTDSSPVQEPVELLDVFNDIVPYLSLPSAIDGSVIHEIEGYIAGAREQAEILQGRDLVTKQWDLSLDYWPDGPIALRDPLRSVDLIEWRDDTGNYTSLVEDVDYIVDTRKHPGIVFPPAGSSWPSGPLWPSSPILVRFTSGPDATRVSRLIKQGMLLLISAWFNNKLPFELGASAVQEYPYAVTSCLSYGALRSVR